MGVNITPAILINNPCYTAGRKISVEGFMLHSVGCPQPNASVFINKWNSSSYNRACVHGFIDANTGEIFQTLPWNHRGWHCGKGKIGSANNTHIGVEMCEPACIKYTQGDRFTCYNKEEAIACAKRTWNSAVKLFAYLCITFNKDPLQDGVIISHKEGSKRGVASAHGDPSHLWDQLGMNGYSMDNFRMAVKNEIEKEKKPKPVPQNILVGNNDEEKIWNFLYREIKNERGVSGLMGNLRAESNLSSINLQDSYNNKFGLNDQQYTEQVDSGKYNNFIKDSAGYGLAQWTYWSRKESLYYFLKNNGYSIGSLQGQLQFLMKELNENYPDVLNTLKHTKQVKDASDEVLLKFEKPADQSALVRDKRYNFSMQFYNKYVKQEVIKPKPIEPKPIEPKPETKPVVPIVPESNNKIYRVFVGKYRLRLNANVTNNRLKRMGYNTLIIKANNFYSVQVGSFVNKENADNLIKDLSNKGIKAIIKEQN